MNERMARSGCGSRPYSEIPAQLAALTWLPGSILLCLWSRALFELTPFHPPGQALVTSTRSLRRTHSEVLTRTPLLTLSDYCTLRVVQCVNTSICILPVGGDLRAASIWCFSAGVAAFGRPQHSWLSWASHFLASTRRVADSPRIIHDTCIICNTWGHFLYHV